MESYITHKKKKKKKNESGQIFVDDGVDIFKFVSNVINVTKTAKRHDFQ